MRLLRGFDEPDAHRGGVLSIGNFDGVHLGHRAIAEMLVARARTAGRPAVVLTFDPHPIRLLRPEAEPPCLSTLERRTDLLGEAGVDVVLAYPTDRALLELTPRAFFDEIVRGRFDARGLVEGPNFAFGRGRAGNVETLRELCDAAGLSFDVVDPVVVDGAVVSSSRARSLLAEGNVRGAARLFGRPYRISGRVVRGAGRGRTIGTPTANLDAIPTLLPAHGVYAARAVTQDAHPESFPAAVNIGPNPTFGDASTKVEAHLVGFDGDLYERTLHLDLLDRIRTIETFDDTEALVRRITEDVVHAVAIADES